MSSPELESFEISDRDLEDEFNINRPQFRPSKHQATYGIWADESDDEGQKRTGFGQRKKKKTADYTEPVNFVTGGIKVGDTTTKTKADEDDLTSEEDEPAPTPVVKKPVKKSSGTAYKKKAVEVGEWEKYTRGIGSKLMEKMGFEEGKGLGKNLQGKSTLVEAFQRKGKGAIGYYGSESNSTPKFREAAPDSEEEESKEFSEKLSQWKKKPQQGDQKKKLRYVYKTADEIISKGDKKKKPIVDSAFSKVKVIDMTGKEQRVTKGYHSISQKHDRPDEDDAYEDEDVKKIRSFDMPELVHNLDLLVKMAEDEIISNNRKLQQENDMIVNLTHEEERLNAICEQEEIQLQKMTNILEIVEKCEKRMLTESEEPLSLEDCAEIFKNLQEEYYQEYKLLELSNLATSVVFPLMKRQLSSWKPLSEPRYNMETIQIWRALLEESQNNFTQGEGNMDAFERLIWDVWMPSIRICINQSWNPRQPENLIELIEAWKPIIPTWVFNNILDQLIMPILEKEVNDWNPLIDTMPIHAWIHPWLLILGNKLEILYGPMRNKLANALTNWHPSDLSAKMMLTPWKGVWIGGHMDAFLVKNISPKLSMCMDEYIINPHQQQLDTWNWVISWIDLLPVPTMSKIIEKHFFPKWHHTLLKWLTSNPNYDEVTHWYMGWKKMFPEPLANSPNIREQFNRALDIMNKAVSGNLQAGSRESVAYLASTERHVEATKPSVEKREGIKSLTAITSVPTSFKDLIEKKAEECGILFIPLQNRFKEGKQIYRFGSTQIYIDRGVVFYLDNITWIPSSLQKLLEVSL